MEPLTPEQKAIWQEICEINEDIKRLQMRKQRLAALLPRRPKNKPARKFWNHRTNQMESY